MRKQDFITELQEAGWEGVHDAQHDRIGILWKRMFPLVAELEDEIEDLEKDIDNWRTFSE